MIVLKIFQKKLRGTALLFAFVVSLTTVAMRGQGAQPPASQNQSDAWRSELAGNSNAPVKIIEFFDYQCPFCAAAIPNLEAAIRSYPGKVQLILKSSPLPIHPDSMLAHQAALAAEEQGKFWEMHRLLYANQRRLKPDNLLDYARQLNLDVERFQNRLQTGYYRPAIEKDVAFAQSLGVEGTPTFFIKNQKLVGAQSQERLKAAIAAALMNPKGTTFDPAAQARAELKELDLSHSPVRGNQQAPVTIIEFSDMQCPFCAAVVPTLRQLTEQYPDQIKWVFKNFPLSFHKDSPLAHRATLAAGEQGKFWEMHDLIFADQRNIKRDDLLQKARSLGLDMERFQADLDGVKLTQLVESDRQEGERLNVQGTPTFFINGKQYWGNMSLAQFQAIVHKELPSGSSTQMAATIKKNRNEVFSGPSDAPITVVWFSDLQSELTLKTTLQVRQLMNAHPGKMRLVFKNRPLETHPGAIRLHEAAMAANAQGKFWQMHDLIIANPHKDDEQTLLSYAARLGLDVERFQNELRNHSYLSAIQEDVAEAREKNILGSPVFFMNGTRLDGLQSQSRMESLVADLLASNMHNNSQKN
jgi:protein-disulfide isomerase